MILAVLRVQDMKQSLWVMACIFAVGSVLGCSSTESGSPKKTNRSNNVELVDCNYYWAARRRHVCIKDMPKKDCNDLFYASGFTQERECVCDAKGRAQNKVEGTGYIQYDCE